MASVRVHFSPGFPLGRGFPAEQNIHVVLCVNRIPPEQKPDSLLPGKFPSLRSSVYRRSNSPPLTSIRIPQEESHFVALPAGATSPLLVRSRTTTPEQIALREILLQEEIQG
jgi:hypothetical protein